METKDKKVIKGKDNTPIDDKKQQKKQIKHRTSNKITIK